ncbi:uncharacterized protein [Anabrus simplex]|uniref:uncharacterized protein n=1 Tax=Anabrus simplex TaxID=316456 RepID=UPI0035A2A0E4
MSSFKKLHENKNMLLILFMILDSAPVDTAFRPRRHLYFPEGSYVQLITGFGLPIHSTPRQDVTFGMVLRYLYDLPTNASEMYPMSSEERHVTEGAARWHFYDILEEVITRSGLDGRACLLRAICEAAETPLGQDSILGEMLHVILTPSRTDEAREVFTDRQYHTAERLGTSLLAEGGACGALYRECPVSLLDYISMT